MTDGKYKILADVVITGGDVTITNIDPINFPPVLKTFTLVENDDVTDTFEDITKRIIGEYTFFNNFYINQNNVIIQFINNKWMLLFFIKIDTDFYLVYYTSTDDDKNTYMNTKDLNRLFQKTKGKVTIIHKNIDVTETIKDRTIKDFKKYNWAKIKFKK